MRALVIILMGLMFAPVMSSAQTTIWKSEDNEQVEIYSWFDLFSLSSNWINATNDDATFQYSRNGLAGPGGAWWPVYVNGVRINTQAWDTQSLHLIPLTLSQLDSVLIVEEPTLYNGVFTEKGAIFIYTEKSQMGWGSQGNMVFGNKSGDPGPFVFTDRVSPNIERVGPLVDGQISYRTDKFSIKAAGSLFYHALMDNVLQNTRLKPILHYEEERWNHVKLNGKSVFTEAAYRTGSFRHSVQAGGSKTEDFLFTDIYGIEVPVDRFLGFVSLKGTGGLSDDLSINYQVGHNDHRTKSFPNKDRRWLNWNQRITEAKSSVNYIYGKGYQEVGVGAKLLSLKDELAGQNLSTSILNVHHKAKHQVLPWLSIHSNIKLVKADKTAIKQAAAVQFKLSEGNSLLFNSSYSERLPAEDNSLWYWASVHGFAQDTLSEYAFGSLPERSKFMKHSIGWKLSKEKNQVSVSFEWTRHRDEYLPDFKLVPNGNSIETGDIEFLSDVDADFFRIPVNVSWNLTPKIYQTGNYTWTHQRSGRTDLFSMIPDHRLTYTINWKPVESFKVWSRIQAQSKTRWNSMQPLDGREVFFRWLGSEVSDFYYAEAPSRFTFDIGIKKYFWEQRFAVSMDLQNINDQHYRYHPLSQMHRFTLFMKASLRLP